MRGAPLLLALAGLAACGQKGPLYLPDKVGKVVTSAPAAPQAQSAPAPATPASAPPPGAAPAVPTTPKPTDKDQEGSQPPK